MARRLKITRGSGNIFLDAGFQRAEAEVLLLRATLMNRIEEHVIDGLTDVPRLTKSQIRDHRVRLEQWQAPAEMLRYCEELMHHMGSTDLFTQAGVDFITEGWAAAKFAQVRGAEGVRLVATRDQWPDFQLRSDGREEPWEFTEADVPGRRRGDEYRQHESRVATGSPQFKPDPVENWIERAKCAPEAIRARCIDRRGELERWTPLVPTRPHSHRRTRPVNGSQTAEGCAQPHTTPGANMASVLDGM